MVGKLNVHRRPGPELKPHHARGGPLAPVGSVHTQRRHPDDVRAAGALVLLYGIQLSRIAGVDGSTAGFSVTLTGPEIALPPALAAILSRLPMQGQPTAETAHRR